MKAQVDLCEECYKTGEKIVCDYNCYYCGKSICRNCVRVLSIKFFNGNSSIDFRTFDISPLCEDCLISFSELDKEFYQNLVNLCAKAFFEQAKKEKFLNDTKIKSEIKEKK